MIVVAGGEGGPTGAYSENEGFDLDSGRWLTLAPLPAGLHGLGAAVMGDSIYFVGGSFSTGTRAATDQLLAFHLA
jgi:hypothetical protein